MNWRGAADAAAAAGRGEEESFCVAKGGEELAELSMRRQEREGDKQ
jgi:hypothetical protein